MFEKAKDLKFIPAGFNSAPLLIPSDELELDRSGNVLAVTYRHKVYSLAISEEGLLFGFRGKVTPEKEADLLILKTSAFGVKVFERRFATVDAIERFLADSEATLSPYGNYLEPAQEEEPVELELQPPQGWLNR